MMNSTWYGMVWYIDGRMLKPEVVQSTEVREDMCRSLYLVELGVTFRAKQIPRPVFSSRSKRLSFALS